MEDNIKKYEPLWNKWYVKKFLYEDLSGRNYLITDKEGNKSVLKVIGVLSSEKSENFSEDEKKDLKEYGEKRVLKIKQQLDSIIKLKENENIISYEEYLTVSSANNIGYDILVRTEYAENLVSFEKENTLSEKDIIKAGTDICKILCECQAKGIVHGNITPESIYVKNGKYMLGDFCLTDINRRTNKKYENLIYNSFETLTRNEVTVSSDIYSLGFIMYERLNGMRLPFINISRKNAKEEDFKKLTEILKNKNGIPCLKTENEELRKTVMNALNTDVQKRFNHPKQMQISLEYISENNKKPEIIRCEKCGKQIEHGTLCRECAALEEEIYNKTAKSVKSIFITALVLILATLGGVFAFLYITRPIKPEKIILHENEAEIGIRETYEILYDVEPENAGKDNIYYRIKDGEECISIDKNNVTGIKEGKAVVLLCAENIEEPFYITVKYDKDLKEKLSSIIQKYNKAYVFLESLSSDEIKKSETLNMEISNLKNALKKYNISGDSYYDDNDLNKFESYYNSVVEPIINKLNDLYNEENKNSEEITEEENKNEEINIQGNEGEESDYEENI